MKNAIATGVLAGAAVLSLAACGASAATAASTTSARPAPSAASPAQSATSEANCSVDCTDPVASGLDTWYAQVKAPLQEVSQDLSQIAADAGNPDGERSGPPACDTLAAHAWSTAMTDIGEAATLEKASTTVAPVAAAVQDANAGFAALATVTAEGSKYAAQS